MTTLWRPVGAYELHLIARTSFRAFPPRLPEQPIFYPVTNEAYAIEIAHGWNLADPNSGFAGFVTRFEVDSEVAGRFHEKSSVAAGTKSFGCPRKSSRPSATPSSARSL